MMSQGLPEHVHHARPGTAGRHHRQLHPDHKEGAEHIGATVKLLEEQGVRVFDVS